MPFRNARQFAKLLEERPPGRVKLLVSRPTPSGRRANMQLEVNPEDIDPNPEPKPTAVPSSITG